MDIIRAIEQQQIKEVAPFNVGDMFITKVLGAMRKLPAVLLALPLGELASPTGLD